MTVMLVRNALYTGRGPVPEGGGLHVLVRRPGDAVRIVSTVVPVWATPADVAVTDEHLRATPEEIGPAWPAVADVVVRAGAGPAPGAGCLIVATIECGRERVVVRRLGCVVETTAVGPAGTFASVVHTWLVTGRSVDGLAGASVAVGRGIGRAVTVRRLAAGAPAAS